MTSLSGTERFPSLRVVRLASDTVSVRDVESYRRVFPDECVLVNALSLSEAGTLTSFLMDKGTVLVTETVPVGYAMPGMDVTVLDEEGRPVPHGEIGEITVGSACIPDGYWRAPELSVGRFRRDPADRDTVVYRTGDLGRLGADGCLEHLGRADAQVKIRGYRVEVAEVERAILALPDVSAVVVVAGGADDRKRLVAYVVARERPGPSVSALRARLTESLPDYMVPSTFVLLDALPLTIGGKVDRAALPKPGARARHSPRRMSPRATESSASWPGSGPTSWSWTRSASRTTSSRSAGTPSGPPRWCRGPSRRFSSISRCRCWTTRPPSRPWRWPSRASPRYPRAAKSWNGCWLEVDSLSDSEVAERLAQLGGGPDA